MTRKKNPHAIALGRRGGRKGGLRRAARLTPERRKEIARKAVLTRWAKAKNLKYPAVGIRSSRVSEPLEIAATEMTAKGFWDSQPVEEIAAAQGVHPLRDVKDLAAVIWKSNDEVAGFLDETYRARRQKAGS